MYPALSSRRCSGTTRADSTACQSEALTYVSTLLFYGGGQHLTPVRREEHSQLGQRALLLGYAAVPTPAIQAGMRRLVTAFTHVQMGH